MNSSKVNFHAAIHRRADASGEVKIRCFYQHDLCILVAKIEAKHIKQMLDLRFLLQKKQAATKQLA